MKPREKGWLKAYIDIRKEVLKDVSSEAQKDSHPEYSLYKIIQPTGLMYGQSVSPFHIPEQETWSNKEKMRVLLAECLIGTALVFNSKPMNDAAAADGVINEAIANIGDFYNTTFPEMSIPTTSFFGKKKDPMVVAETILNKRVDYAGRHEKNFWAYFFHNSLLFLDAFIFGQWVHTKADKIVADFFRYERDELRFSVVKVIAAAAHSNEQIEFEEKKLLEIFLQSADLSSEKKKEAQMIFESGLLVQDLQLPSENSWILRKFFLEMAILTLWADKKVEAPEIAFIDQFRKYLRFSEEDVENSMIAVEGFVLEYWEELGYLQNRQEFDRVSEQFIARVSNITEKNKGRLLKEIQSDRNLIQLLRKGKSNELNDDEKEEVRLKLIQILRSIPTFVLVSLPNRFLTLPILMRVLPKELFTEALA